MTPREPVAVVGAGVKCPVGETVEEMWSALLDGQAAGRVYAHDQLPAGIRVIVAGVDGFDPREYVRVLDMRTMDRTQLLAIAAADDALAGVARPEPRRCAVVVGTAHGAGASIEHSVLSVTRTGAHGLSPLAAPTAMTSSIAAALAMRYGFEGRCLTVATACAASADAVGVGAEMIRSGAADLVLAGGVEAPIYLTSVVGFGRTGATSRRETAEGASRPFDRDRDGFVLSEGAAFVVLQRRADAEAAGAPVQGLVLGYGSTCDAFHISAPREDGRCVRDCIEVALADAGVGAGEIDHVNAHGTSTRRNDLAEGRVIESMYGRAAPPVTAVKGATGHLIGGSGALEAIVTLRTLQHGLVPPTAGHENLDAELNLDLVTGKPRAVDAALAVSHSFGFGGANAVLVLGRA